MEQAKSILPRLFQQAQGLPLEEFDLIEAYWPRTVGPLLAEHSRPARLDGTVLVVDVDGADWADLLGRMREQIVGLVRTDVSWSKVRDIDFRLAAAPREPRRSRRKP